MHVNMCAHASGDHVICMRHAGGMRVICAWRMRSICVMCMMCMMGVMGVMGVTGMQHMHDKYVVCACTCEFAWRVRVHMRVTYVLRMCMVCACTCSCNIFDAHLRGVGVHMCVMSGRATPCFTASCENSAKTLAPMPARRSAYAGTATQRGGG